ncbi:MAG: AAA family ATPase [Clostridia bacterium]|nr:AAA family ATPase [Clostridia bacterium]
MKKFLSIVLTLAITINMLPVSASSDASSTEHKELFVSSFLRKWNSTGVNSAADFIDENFNSPQNIFSFFEKYGSRSILCVLLATGFNCFNAIISKAQGFMNTLWVYDYMKEKLRGGVHLFDWTHPIKDVPVNETMARLHAGLQELKGQENAKKEITKIVSGIAHNKNQAAFNKEEYSHGDVIYILGPSGVGKTFVSLRIAYALSNHEPFIISASEVDLQNKDTVIDQLFNFDDYYFGYGASIKECKRLVKYLKNHKGGVVIINEYDKMWSPALDEVLRTITDQGIINIRGQTIYCKGTTFIITSNECTQAIESGNQDLISDAKEIDDGTGSRTNLVKHDRSFLNRVKKVIFENLTEEDYENIAKNEYGEKFKNYWKDFANIDLNMESIYSHIAKKAVKENKGSRIINSVMDGLTKELAEFTEENNRKGQEPINVCVSYDEDADKFSLDVQKEN